MNSKQDRQTRTIELVETGNLAISINRLKGPPYDDGRWKRALYHAVCMTIGDYETRKLIREALKLP